MTAIPNIAAGRPDQVAKGRRRQERADIEAGIDETEHLS
jgi:hypothetical protein